MRTRTVQAATRKPALCSARATGNKILKSRTVLLPFWKTQLNLSPTENGLSFPSTEYRAG